MAPTLLVPPTTIQSPPRGVQFNAPPIEQIPSIRASLERAISNISEGKHAAFIAIPQVNNGKYSVNVAFVTKTETEHYGTWSVGAWIGKFEGESLNAGVELIAEF